LDSSTVADASDPRLAVPGAPVSAAPDFDVSVHALLPIGARPSGAVKFASAICASGFACPFV
jgi:hypothetical protein